MKIFVIGKNTVAVIIIVSAVILSLLFFPEKNIPVYNSYEKDYPIYCVDTKENKIAITFDTAWGNEDIDNIIRVLDDAGCKATFFVTGVFAEKFPEDVKKLQDAGHEIANHSYNHEHYNKLSESEMEQCISKGEDAIKKITGQERVLFRAPYGEYNKTLVSLCKKTDRYIIQWSKDSLDYKGLSEDAMKKRIITKLCGGDIILFHTGTENTASCLSGILEEISKKGFSFATVSELIYDDDFEVNHEGKQIKN